MSEEVCALLHPNQTDKDPWQALLDEENEETLYKLPTFILLSILMVVGLPGNVLVLLVYGFKFPASTTKSFILAMAVFDLINCALGMPFEMVDLRYDIDFNIPVACKIIRFWISLSACGSVTVLVTVSVDRFRRICRAFNKQMTVRQSRVLIGVMALISIMFSVPALILYGRHTEIRYGMVLQDCSIDDKYKNGKFSALYQYVLGGTWFICIVILIIMYSFIIFKIRQQQTRREKLSNQSYDSTVLTKHKVLPQENNFNENKNAISRSNHEHSSLVKYAEGSANNGRLQFDYNTLDQVADDSVSSEGRNSKSISRLFSRDVNPVFAEGDGSDEMDDMKFCDNREEHIFLSEFSCRENLMNCARRSVGNNRPASLNTRLTNTSSTVVQRDTTEASGLIQGRDLSEHGPRKYARLLAKQRPWESEELMHQISFVSPASECDCTFHSDHVLGAAETPVLVSSCQNKRTSSLCSLKCVRKEGVDDQVNNNSQLPENKTSSCTNVSKDDNITPLQLTLDAGDNTEAYSEGLVSNNFVKETCKQDPQVGIKFCQLDSISDQANYLQTELKNLQCSATVTQPKKKYTSASIDTTFSQKRKKKSHAREIKTSKVSLMMLMVTVGFVLSYLPHLGIQIFKNLYPVVAARLLCNNQVYFVSHHFLMRFFFINNAINPIIYSFYNKTFRHRCVRLLKSPSSLFYTSERYVSGAPSISQDNDTA